MNVRELIEELSKYEQDVEVCCSSDTGYSWWSYPVRSVKMFQSYKDGEISVEGKEKRLCLMPVKN